MKLIRFFICIFILSFVISFCNIPIYAASHKTIKEYDDLTSEQQDIADDIWDFLKYSDKEDGYSCMKISTDGDEDDIDKAISALEQTHFPYYGEIYTKSYTDVKTDDDEIIWNVYFHIRKTKNAYHKNKVADKKAEKWIRKCTNRKMSKRQKAKAIAKYISNKTKYKSSQDQAFYLFKNKKGNSYATAMLYKRMLHKIGIKSCRVVIGERKDKTHVWNTFKVNGKQYYTDITCYRNTKNDKFIVSRNLPKTKFY